MTNSAQKLVRGTVDILILKSLATEARHGFAISRWIARTTDDALGVEDAALYQALHRLQHKGWIASEWGLSENNRRARFYSLTDRGRKRLASELSTWRDYVSAVTKVVES